MNSMNGCGMRGLRGTNLFYRVLLLLYRVYKVHVKDILPSQFRIRAAAKRFILYFQLIIFISSYV